MKEVEEFGINFLIAGIIAAISKTVCAPIERIKLTLQNQHSAIQIINKEMEPYKGILDCFIRFPKEQGYLSFWRGNGINIIRYFPNQALNFAFNHLFQDQLLKDKNCSRSGFSIIAKFLSGGLAGLCSNSIVYPLDFCQTRISVDLGASKYKKSHQKVKREFNGLNHCFVKVTQMDGLRGFYKGYSVTIVGVVFYRSLYFGLYDLGKTTYASRPLHEASDVKLPFFVALLIAQAGTSISSTLSYPLDTVGRRLMMESGRSTKKKLYRNTFHAFKVIYRTGGLSSFFKGWQINCLRGLSGALVLVTYDEVWHYTKEIKK